MERSMCLDHWKNTHFPMMVHILRRRKGEITYPFNLLMLHNRHSSSWFIPALKFQEVRKERNFLIFLSIFLCLARVRAGLLGMWAFVVLMRARFRACTRRCAAQASVLVTQATFKQWKRSSCMYWKFWGMSPYVGDARLDWFSWFFSNFTISHI